jgi:hypothetical protein
MRLHQLGHDFVLLGQLLEAGSDTGPKVSKEKTADDAIRAGS